MTNTTSIRMILGFYHEPNFGEAHLGHIFLEPVHDEKATRKHAEENFEEYEIFDMPVDLELLTDVSRPYITNRPDLESEEDE